MKVNDYWNQCYDKNVDFRLASSQSISKFLSYFGDELPKNCLDIGCGTGQLSRELNHRGIEVTGLDASYSAIKQAKSLTNSSTIDYIHLDFENDDITKINAKSFQLVTCKLVFAFIKNKPEFLKKVLKLLDKNGLFVIITPLPEDVTEEKKGIAVDFDETTTLLKQYFLIEAYKENNQTVFICKK